MYGQVIYSFQIDHCVDLESSLGDIGLVAVTIVIVLTTTRTRLNSMSATIVVCTRGVIPGTTPSGSGVRIIVPAGGEVVMVGVIGIGLVVTLHIRSVRAGVSTLVSDAGIRARAVRGRRTGIARVIGKPRITGIDLSISRKDAHKDEGEGDKNVFHNA